MQLQASPSQVSEPKMIIQLLNPALQPQMQTLSLSQDLCIACEQLCKYKQQKSKQLSAYSTILAAVIFFKANNMSVFDISNLVTILEKASKEKKSYIIKSQVQSQYSSIYLIKESWKKNIHISNLIETW